MSWYNTSTYSKECELLLERKEKAGAVLATIADAEKQYDLFVSSGCSVHEFNRLKGSVRILIDDYVRGEGEQCYQDALQSLSALLVWIGRRVNVAGKEGCVNCELDRGDSSFKQLCAYCDRNAEVN